MNLEKKKSSLLAELNEVRRSILDISARIPEANRSEAFLGSWCVLDLLAHLEGWDHTNKQAAEEVLQGRVPSFYDEYDKDWAAYNAKLLLKYRRDTMDEMVNSVRESHHQLMKYLEGLTPEEIFGDRGVRRGSYKVIISRLMEAEKKDEFEHLKQIEGYAEGKW